MMSKQTEYKSSKNVRRVESWIYCIINPIVNALKREVHFLTKKNLTWQFYTKKAEYIFHLDQYVESKYENIYEHYLRTFPEYSAKFQKHNELLEYAEKQATEFFDALKESQDFTSSVSKKLEEFTKKEPYPGGAVPKEKFCCLVIGYIINEAQELPGDYNAVEFWLKHGKSLRAKVKSDFSEQFEKLSKAKKDLLLHSQNLMTDLKEFSFQLCEKYDIPADPVEDEAREY